MHPSFGTDGVRAVANEQLTPELALALGRATVRVLGASVVHVGRDPRRSGPMIESAVLAGVCAEGAHAVALGVVPTPMVAMAAAGGTPGHPSGATTAGVMISASHNPFSDNGLKIFAPGGRKLTDAEQQRIERELARLLDGAVHPGPAGAEVGTVGERPQMVEAYIDHVTGVVEGRDLHGLSVVLDCANGANSEIGPTALRRLGAELTVIGARPDGTNINAGCGSTHLDPLAAAVVARGADVGIAFDGDADRMLAVDHLGRVVDGDQLLAICALDMRDRGLLRDDAVVVTVMTNLGFRQAMGAAGIEVVDTPVGDRHVLEALESRNLSLGGEQSGHLIFRDLSTTGDGLLSAVVVLDLLQRSGRRLAKLCDTAMTRLPQVLENVRVAAPFPDVAEALGAEIAHAEAQLGDNGRILLRPSGTEPVVRVMVEAADETVARGVADRLAACVREASRRWGH